MTKQKQAKVFIKSRFLIPAAKAFVGAFLPTVFEENEEYQFYKQILATSSFYLVQEYNFLQINDVIC